MCRQKWYLAIGMLGLGALLCGCPETPDGGDPDGDNGPSSFATGLVQPEAGVVEALPQAINPYAAAANQSLPATADLTDLAPPIGNQGQMGSCTAWASGYAGATYIANRAFAWGVNSDAHRASPAYLYGRLLATDGFNCGSGTRIQTAMNLLVQEGCSSLATLPYSDQACETNPPATDAASFRPGSYNRVDQADRNAVKGELASGHIVVFGAKLYTDFMNATGDSVFVGNGEFLVQGSQHAAHAMALVGYDDNRGAYRVMNSWGNSWGDAGFMWMRYETWEATAFEAYSLEPGADRDPPDPDPEPDPTPVDPDGYLDASYQFAEVDDAGKTNVYLVFEYHFTAAVLINEVRVTDPDGATGVQNYGTWFTDGYVYFLKEAFEWEAGIYNVEFDVTTEAGNNITYTGEAKVDPLDGSGPTDLCDDSCYWAYDGWCDDGGLGSDYDVCELGTDCSDCGNRDGSDNPDEICSNTCEYAGDGACDDGGPGAEFSVCEFGSDCSDCGSRSPDEGGGICDNACAWAYDGACDDGGEGSEYNVCDYGSDCFDCGSRSDAGATAKAAAPAKNKNLRIFRGVVIQTVPDDTAPLTPRAMDASILGANRKPATFIPAAK